MYLSGCTLSPLQWSPWTAICLFQSQCCGQKVWTPACGFPSEWAFIFCLFMVLVSLHSSRVVLNCGGVRCSICWMRLKNIVWGKNSKVLLVSFGFLCFWGLSYMFVLLYLLFLWTLQKSRFTFASRLLEVDSDDCLQGKLPHWMNKSWGVHLLTSYPSHVGHGAPCFSFRLIHTMSFVSTLRSLRRRRLNIQWQISCPKSDNLRSSANSSICQKLY